MMELNNERMRDRKNILAKASGYHKLLSILLAMDWRMKDRTGCFERLKWETHAAPSIASQAHRSPSASRVLVGLRYGAAIRIRCCVGLMDGGYRRAPLLPVGFLNISISITITYILTMSPTPKAQSGSPRCQKAQTKSQP
ncbi:Allergen Asp f 4 [Fusarium oxysporum f. sp. albedinis]|nr:Allergen Asp f 4 [Fusarium oxysporum f. sp. albedinis]